MPRKNMYQCDRIATCLAIVLLAFLSLGHVAVQADTETLNRNLHLLVDDDLVAQKQNLTRTLHAAQKLSTPALEPTQPWEGDRVYCAGAVIYDPLEKRYHMWYKSSGTCYAYSGDGINWIRPQLRLHSYGGSNYNNIVFPRNCITVHYDRHESNPNQRFKMLGADGTSGFWGAYSADGIYWSEYAANPIMASGSEVASVIRDVATGEFLNYVRPHAPRLEVGELFGRRYIGLAVGTDMTDWSSIENIITPDAEDDAWVTEPQQRTEFYSMSGFTYGDMYLGLLQVFRITDIIEDRVSGQSAYEGPIHSQLVHSRDGRTWHRYDGRAAVIANGPYDYDAGCIMFAANEPIVVDDHVYHYYTAINTTHGGVPGEKRITIGRAAWRKDGYVSLDAGSEEGFLETQPLDLVNRSLVINANASAGYIAAEIVTADGQVVYPGYARQDCVDFTGDSVNHRLNWQSHTTLDMAGPIRLRFYMQNAELYSFCLTPCNDVPPPVHNALVCNLTASSITANDLPNDGGLAVVQMMDGSGQNNDAWQVILPSAPKLIDDEVLGKPVVAFDNDQHLEVVHATNLNTDNNGGYTVVAYARQDAPPTGRQRWLGKGCEIWAGYDPGWSFWFYTVSGSHRMYMATASEGPQDADHHAMAYKHIELSKYHTYSMVLDGSEIAMFVDGEPRDGTVSFHWDYTGNINNTNRIHLGTDGLRVAEVLIYQGQLSETERLQVEQYLQDKYPSLTWPPGNCAALWNYGLGWAEDLNQDCHVNLSDLHILVNKWLELYDPQTN